MFERKYLLCSIIGWIVQLILIFRSSQLRHIEHLKHKKNFGDLNCVGLYEISIRLWGQIEEGYVLYWSVCQID